MAQLASPVSLEAAQDTYRRYSEQASAAVLQLDDPEKVVHLSYGDLPACEYLKHITTFRGFRAYNIAKWIGIDTTLPSNLVQGLWEEILPEVEQWRQIGVFGPAIPLPDDAPLQDRLLGLVGRDPLASRMRNREARSSFLLVTSLLPSSCPGLSPI